MMKSNTNKSFQKIHFESEDGLLITADYFPVNNPKGFILLCHRSHCNRGEYRETAPKLNKLGFTCLAIDQRSGMKVFGVTNETKVLAKEKGLSTGYLDTKYMTQFKPTVEGFHGSKTLWESVKGYETFWNALKKFLLRIQKPS